MKVVAFNCSPKAGRSNTSLILQRVCREITPLDRFVTTSNKICRQSLDALRERDG